MTNETISGQTSKSHAIALANVDAPLLDTALETVLQAKQEWDGSKMTLMFAMSETYTAEQIAEFPVIMTPPNKSGNNPEVFKVDIEKNGNRSTVSVNFYHQFADNTKVGKAVNKELDYLSRLSSENARIDDIPQEFQDAYPGYETRRIRQEFLKTRRNSIRAAYKGAVKLIQQFQRVNSLEFVEACEIPKVDGKGFENLVKVSSNVEGREALDVELYSIGAFLKLDADKARENGGTYAALKGTVVREGSRGQGNKEEAGIPKLASIETPETFDKVMVAVHSYLDSIWSDKKGTQYAALLASLNPKSKDGLGESRIETLGDLHAMLGDLLKMDAIGNAYAIIKEKALKAA